MDGAEDSSSQERMRILEMIESGTITAEQGLALLRAISAPDDDLEDAWDGDLPLPGDGDADEQVGKGRKPVLRIRTAGDTTNFAADDEVEIRAVQPDERLEQRVARFKRLWIIPMGIGLGLTAAASLLVYAALASSGGAISLGFLCATVPLSIGLLTMLLAWGSRSARWLYLHVQQPPGEKPQNIIVALPLPLRFGAWFVSTFGAFIPKLRDQRVEDILQMINQATTTGSPIMVEVDEGDNGDKVEIFIG
jgi:hypothetical protein